MRYSSLIPAVIGVSLLILPACSGTSSQVSRLEERIAALENEQYNFQAKQESLNAWEAGRLSVVESKHPDITVPPPPKYTLRETAPAAAQSAPAPGEVVETSPGQARIDPAPVQTPPPVQASQTASNSDAQAVKVYPSPLSAAGAAPAAPVAAAPSSPAAPAAVVTVTQPAGAQLPSKPAAAPQAAKPAQTASTGEKGEYASALRLIERGKNAEGRAAMDKFMGKYPSSKLTPNAIYWKGETYYGERNYQEAILAFRDVAARFPNTAKAADAMLKIGMSYQRMGDNQNARFYLEQVLSQHPSTRAANLARQQLNKLP